MKKIFILCALMTSMYTAAAAHPWVQENNRYIVSVTTAFRFCDSVLDDAGNENRLPGDMNSIETLVFYNEGYNDKSDLSVQTGFVYSKPEFAAANVVDKPNAGLADTRIRYKWQFRDSAVSAAAIVGLKIPGTYSRNRLNAPGKGQVDIELGASVGQHTAAIQTYWSVDAFYRMRMGNPDDEFEYDIEAGRKFTNKLNTRVFYQRIDSLGGVRLQDTAYGGGARTFQEMETDTSVLGLSVEYELKSHRAISLTWADTINGRNALDSTDYYLSYIMSH